MDCKDARTHWLDRRRGTLPEELRAPLDAHLASCRRCQQDEAADAALSVLLATRLVRRPAPDRLRRSLESRWDTRAGRFGAMRRVSRTLGAMSVGAGLAVAVMLARGARGHADEMVTESVNDHLRVLYSSRPLEVESGGLHQVKPWFEGRLDFAPVVPFAGDDDFPLQGGAVAYFLDRKAATFVYRRRLHVITLFVFQAAGLPWPKVGLRPVGDAQGTMQTERGFHVLRWRQGGGGDLGYALVSDVDERDLIALAEKIAVPQ
ncbi:MAG: hypothetical protein M3O36_11150 [Myxococcota bacterium]|nr:hypothetical protein [Myxococcota bacterium]